MKKKITDEMIMDFADGVLSERDSKLVIEQIKKDKKSREKFLKFQKTSTLFGSTNEKFYESQPIPKSIIRLINFEKNRNRKSTKNSLLDVIRNYLLDFNIKQNLVVASLALMIGFFSQNLFEKEFTSEVLYRSGVSDDFDKMIVLGVRSNDVPIKYGQALKNRSNFTLEITSKEDGEIFLEFPNENVTFNFLVKKNKKQIFFEDKDYIAEKPEINFKLIFKNKKIILEKDFYFLVK